MSSPTSTKRASEGKQNDRLRAVVGLGTEVVGGGLTGAAAGFLIGGPAGSVVGGVLAPVVKRGLQELVQRVMSHREEVRVSAAAQFALERYQAVLAAGVQLRDDMPTGGDKGFDELLEGILQKARNSYKEKKVRLLANIFADFAFTKGVSVEDTHAVLVLVESLTYRQMVLLAVFQEEHRDGLRESNCRGQTTPPLGTIAVLEDVYQLFLRGLVVNQPPGAEQSDFMLGWHDVTPVNMRLTSMGGAGLWLGRDGRYPGGRQGTGEAAPRKMSGRQSRQQKLLLLTGIPGTGKTESGHVLEEHHGFVHLDAELHAMSRRISSRQEWEELWDDFLRQVESYKESGRGIVITWGFMPGVDDKTIRRLQNLGFTMIWFDGDRNAARRQFLKRGTVGEDLLDLQMSRIAGLDLESFRPVHFNPFDESGRFLPQRTIAERLIDVS